jgi:alkylhydroperoxidase family enzyme
MLAYAEKLTLSPAEMTAGDLEPMRAAGLTDEAILHVCEIASYFNYINRMADGLGVTLEPDWEDPILLIGPEPSA